MSNVVEYKRPARKTMREAFSAHVVDMKNKTTREWREMQDKQRKERAYYNLVAAYRENYLIFGDTAEADAMRIKADMEARRVLACQL